MRRRYGIYGKQTDRQDRQLGEEEGQAASGTQDKRQLLHGVAKQPRIAASRCWCDGWRRGALLLLLRRRDPDGRHLGLDGS